MIESHDNQVALAKVVFFGPEGSGKATTLSKLLERIPSNYRSELSRIDSHGDTLLSVDVVPAKLPPVAGRAIQLQLATVTGPVTSDVTIERLLEDADGVVFVADCRVGAMNENMRMLESLEIGLADIGLDLAAIPIVLQNNHRDARRLYTLEEMGAKLNPQGAPAFETVASEGRGIFLVLKAMTEKVVPRVTELLMQRSFSVQPAREESAPVSEKVDDDITFQAPEPPEQTPLHEDDDGRDQPEAGGAGRSMFSFPETKRTYDGEGPSAPFGSKEDGDDNDDKGGMWRRLATRFRK